MKQWTNWTMVTELINYNFDQYTDGNGIGGCGYSICDESFWYQSV